MNTYTSFAAAALLAAPACLVAHAVTIEESIEEGVTILNDLCSILENTTPENVDANLAEIDKLHDRMQALKESEDQISEADKARALENPELMKKLEAPLQRLVMAMLSIHMKMQEADEAQQEAMQKVIDKIESFQP